MNVSPFKPVSYAPRPVLLSRVAAIVLGAMALAGCTDRLATGSTVSDDYRERHRIVFAERPVTLDIRLNRKLDVVAKRRILEFAEEAQAEGVSVIEVMVPAGAFNERDMRALAPSVKEALVEGGFTANVSLGSYPAADMRASAPLRLSYRAVRARVSHRCGQWPADLTSGSSLDTWDNRPYWNLGCSYQNMIATQLDDPRDLEAPRASSPVDVQMRTRAIGVARQGGDPGGGRAGSSGFGGQTGGVR